MDNFRRPKRLKQHTHVDGFVRHKSSHRKSGVGDFERRPSPMVHRQTVGDFRQADGFRAGAQPAISAAATASSGAISSGPAWGQTAHQPARKVPTIGLPTHTKKTAAKKPRRWRQLAKRTAVALVALLVIGGGYVGAKAYINARHVLKGGGNAAALGDNVDPSLLKGEGDGRVNILLLGRGGDGHEGPDLTDTLIIASIDPVHKEAALVSIPRDLWVKPSGSGGYTKINAVYADAKYRVLNGKKVANQAQAADNAGQEAIEKTIEDTFGIPIHYHTMVDFEGFRKAIDTVGGVDVNVKTALVDPTVAWENNWKATIAPVGQQHFDGKKALLYARSRHGSARGDFDRAERQREIMVALKDKVLSIGTFGNPLKISQLIDAFGNHVQTNFNSNEAMRLYNIVKQIPSDKVMSVGLADPPNDYVTTSMVNGASVVIPKAGIGNYAALQSYIRNTLKDSYIKDENASIAVYNATNTPGLAAKKAEELKSFGYNITQVSDAPTKGATTTVLVDMRGGQKKYTKHYLESRLKVTATGKVPEGIDPGTADFVIVLGSNAVGN